MTFKNEYLAELLKKREELNALIAHVQAFDFDPSETNLEPPKPTKNPHRKTGATALMEQVIRENPGQTCREITNRLEELGCPYNGTVPFYNNVHALLYRMIQNGKIEKSNGCYYLIPKDFPNDLGIKSPPQ